jgi:sterol desaturase/sphingolipid hydroxylase (fatty acid hydroxylase superfamily)
MNQFPHSTLGGGVQQVTPAVDRQAPRDRLRVLLSSLPWPVLAAASCWITKVGLDRGIDGSFIVAADFLFLAAALVLLERVFPHEELWQDNDGEVAHDVVFTLLGSGLPGAIAHALVLAALVGVAEWIARHAGGSVWPVSWPVPAQIALVVAIGDFGAYWGHRLFHEIPALWPYHAVHHVVRRLWWMNSGRVHPIDSFVMIVFSIPLLVLAGAPEDMMVWLAIFTTFVGMLSHCNVEMRCGWLDWIFNTPGVHRWHHSRVLAEGNHNYGENTMIWDVVFGTHYRQALRRPPVMVGSETTLPTGIGGQFLEPFRMCRSIVASSFAKSAAPQSFG